MVFNNTQIPMFIAMYKEKSHTPVFHKLNEEDLRKPGRCRGHEYDVFMKHLQSGNATGGEWRRPYLEGSLQG